MPATLSPARQAREELTANLMAIPAAVAVILAVVAYWRTGSGVDGTLGAGLAIVGTLVLTLAAVLVGRLSPGRARTTLAVMILITGILTLVCAFFLMQGWLMLFVALTLAIWLVFILVAD